MIVQTIADVLPLVLGVGAFLWLASLLVVFSLCRRAQRGNTAIYEREEGPVYGRCALITAARPFCDCRGIVGEVGRCDGGCSHLEGRTERRIFRP